MAGITRRRFLGCLGGAVGASVLVCGTGGLALTWLDRTPAEVTFVEKEYRKDEAVKQKVLMAYASKAGSTGEIAQAVAEELSQAGFAVDVRRVQDVKDMKDYQAVVLGSAARYGKLLPEALSFAQKYRAQLSGIPVAYFFSGATLCEDTPQNRATASAYLDPLRQVRAPLREGLFGGKIDYARLSPLWRMLLSNAKPKDLPEGDYRNWDAIRAWSRDLAASLG